MKHLKFSVFGLILVIALAAALFNIRHGDSHVRPENLVSDQAVVFVRFANVKERLKDFEGSVFWKHIRTVRLDGVLPEMQEDEDWAKKVEEVWNDPVFQTLFGRELAVAVYPGPQDSGENEAHVVLISRLDRGGPVLDSIIQWAGRWNKDITTSEEEYKGATITRLASQENPEQTLYYVRVHNYLVLGADVWPLQQSLDVAAKRSRRLSDDPVFQQTMVRLEDTKEGLAFTNMERVSTLVEERWTELRQNPWLDNAAGDQDVPAYLEKLKPFKGHAITWTISDKALRSKAFTAMDIKLYNTMQPHAQACPPAANGTWTFVPQDVIAYSWTNCQDFMGHWQDFKEAPSKSPDGQPTGADISAQVYTALGVRVEEDVLPVFGDEAAFAVGDGAGQAGVPVPPLLGVIKITDAERAKVMMRELTENPLLVRDVEMYNGVSVTRLRLAFLSNVEAAYAIVGEYLLVSSDTGMLQRSLDIYSDPVRSLKSAKLFKAADAGLTQQNNSVLYLEPARLAQRVKEGIQWAQSILVMKINQGEAFMTGARQKYNGIKADLDEQDRHIRENRTRVKELSDKRAQMEANGESASFQASQVESLEMEYQTLQYELSALKAQEEELRRTIQTYEERMKIGQQNKTLVDGVLFPLLDALSAFQAHTTRMWFDDSGAVTESLTTLK